MIIAESASAIPISNGKCGFVPTMGFLHEGHMSLVHLAREKAEQVVLSIYVNPTQFGPNEDYSQYPRDLDRDLALAEANGVDVVYLPSTEEIYPHGPNSPLIHIGEIGTVFEGRIRPGHFDGVATVVARLFELVKPDGAWFGQKDLQQWAVLNQLVKGFAIPVTLAMGPTIRESNGLAMSSRNTYLSEAQKSIASTLSQQLLRLQTYFPNSSWDQFLQEVSDSRNIVQSVMDLDYLDVINRNTFTKVYEDSEDLALIAAVRVGSTRLLDNVLLS